MREDWDPDYEPEITWEMDEDSVMKLEVESSQNRFEDPCRKCQEKNECMRRCADRIEYDECRVEVDWDNKPSRMPEIY